MGSAAGKSSRNIETYARRAHHAGSWYDDEAAVLHSKLREFLSAATGQVSTSQKSLRALICPHAGYSYSGPTAGYSYAALWQELSKPETPVRRILVLHPSHHVYLEGCAVSKAHVIETPVGNLRVDEELRDDILRLSDKFTLMTKKTDEEEHSGEMQYPFLAYILKETNRLDQIPILPVMCGNLSTEQERQFGQYLSEIIARADTLTVCSSDFCHWGRRFQYQPTASGADTTGTTTVPIYEFIEQMDRRGMDLIAAQQPGAFAEYLKETRNTICGRHAIAVWMRAVEASNSGPNKNSNVLQLEFVTYAQSSAAKSLQDSSVSYAAAVATTSVATT